MRRIGLLTSLVFTFSVFCASAAQAKTPLQKKHEAKGAAAKAASKAKSDARRAK